MIEKQRFDGASSLAATYDYDSIKLIFRANTTRLLCELRRANAPPYCPDFQSGTGTSLLTAFPNKVAVDQTGLSITPDPAGLPSAGLSYTAPQGISITGERNALALAFDLVEPDDQGPQSPTALHPCLVKPSPQARSSARMPVASGCLAMSATLPRRWRSPRAGPLAFAGLPVMAHTSRGIRRRVRLAATR